MADRPIRVAVVSRNHIVRAGLVSLIAQLDAQALVTDAVTADDTLGAHDVAIYDLGADEGRDDYTDLRRLTDAGLQVIGLVYDVRRDTLPAVADETSHLITLSTTPEQLIQVLRTTTPRVMAGPGRRDADAPGAGLPAGLTDREFAVVELIGAGLSNQEVADRLYLSINSVKTYIRSSYRKMGVSNRAGATRWALGHGLSGGTDQRSGPRSRQ